MEHHHLTPRDWDVVADDPTFRDLLSKRRRFVIPATIFFAAYYFSLPILVGAAPALMRAPVWGDLTFGYIFAFSQFAMAWILLALYVRRAKTFDELEAKVVARVREELEAL
ncbi:MAG TPA: DUF485 domain-containing protein [Verrucomicrobiae bacterium]|nr:DUF485 domain-containing protein [Verrucomicrobiae bacterium]